MLGIERIESGRMLLIWLMSLVGELGVSDCQQRTMRSNEERTSGGRVRTVFIIGPRPDCSSSLPCWTVSQSP
jgi:hypothetical protein